MSRWQVEPLRGRGRGSWWFDTGVVLAAVLLSATYTLDTSRQPGVLKVALLLALTLPLLVRRIWPVPVFAWVYLVAAVAGWSFEQAAWSQGLVVALYTVAARCPRRQALTAAGALGVAVVVATWHSVRDGWFFAAGSLLVVVGGVTVLGLYMATRRTLLLELQARAVQLERERDQQGELAAAAERARIAREMHDIVAHHLTVMVALSDGAAAVAGGDAAAAMRTVSATGREALADTRRLLGVLRDPVTGEADRSPLPDLGDLDDLVGRVRAAGLPVRFEVVGTPPVLPAAEQLTLYRLVQEALTNTLKHAGPAATAAVCVRYGDDGVRVVVEDDGTGAAVVGQGRGLAGMRERVAAFGGTVEAGPQQPRGWKVSAWVAT